LLYYELMGLLRRVELASFSVHLLLEKSDRTLRVVAATMVSRLSSRLGQIGICQNESSGVHLAGLLSVSAQIFSLPKRLAFTGNILASYPQGIRKYSLELTLHPIELSRDEIFLKDLKVLETP